MIIQAFVKGFTIGAEIAGAFIGGFATIIPMAIICYVVKKIRGSDE